MDPRHRVSLCYGVLLRKTMKFCPSRWCIGTAGEMYVEGPCLESQIRYSGLTAGIPHLCHLRKLVLVSHLVKPRIFQIHFAQH